MFRQSFELHIARIEVRNIRYDNATLVLFRKGGMTELIPSREQCWVFFSRVTERGKKLGQHTIPQASNSYTPQQGSTNVLVGRPNRHLLQYSRARPSKEKLITLIFNVSPNYLLLRAEYVISHIRHINKRLQKQQSTTLHMVIKYLTSALCHTSWQDSGSQTCQQNFVITFIQCKQDISHNKA